MYQWIDPDSGTTQLSGKPPVWYRSTEGGPRIIVIEKGKIIDDTDIKISEEYRDMLRQRALMKVEEDRTAALQKAKQAEKLKSEFDSATDEIATKKQETDSALEDITSESVEIAESALDEEEITMTEPADEEVTVKEMRARIQDWENKRTEDAKKLLDPGS